MVFFFLQLLYELCLDPLTCGPTMDLLSNKKYQFFVKVQHALSNNLVLLIDVLVAAAIDFCFYIYSFYFVIKQHFIILAAAS